MRAMQLSGVGTALHEVELPEPRPGQGQVQLQVHACGVCRTDLHIVDGELAEPKLPLVLGHQIVGTVSELGRRSRFEVGQRVGVPWLGWTCGRCRYCRSGRENLCDTRALHRLHDRRRLRRGGGGRRALLLPDPGGLPRPTGGAASLRRADRLPRAAVHGRRGAGRPLRLRRRRRTSSARSPAHEGRRVFAFTRPGDEATQAFARSLGAEWAGASEEQPPEALDAAIIFAPAGELVPTALAAVDKGGSVVCAGIHMSEIPAFSYDLLWEERVVRSVANLTRADGEEFLERRATDPGAHRDRGASR